MNFLDKLVDRFRKKVDAKNDEVKRNTESYDRLAALGGILGVGGGYRRSREEVEFEKRSVPRAKLSRRLPFGSTMFHCRNGFYIKLWGHTPFSGPAPSQRAAERAALRNLGL
jgi:hypothetical protein